ncbi:hypothetical protein KEU06_23885 [Pseudaminobacter sp. 19-2017]|uniref:Tc1-like transposase DDE domain-containing protein n=1 Tax=Pseudaminobacter soli (ex Zhang et al. 2022) TaxID=2831468 RepID=A0A942I4B5_9HYPH|nr:hypothetical protein [Pseudaminobacter soli]
MEQFLASALQPGDVVVMDNLGSHKGPSIRRAIRGGGRQALLPDAIQDLSKVNSLRIARCLVE